MPEESVFSIYPNPVEEVLSLTGWENIDKLILMHTNGKQIRSWQSVIPQQIDMQILPSGTYYLMFESEGRMYARKVVKK